MAKAILIFPNNYWLAPVLLQVSLWHCKHILFPFTLPRNNHEPINSKTLVKIWKDSDLHYKICVEKKEKTLSKHHLQEESWQKNAMI